jgi:hypothetical protein
MVTFMTPIHVEHYLNSNFHIRSLRHRKFLIIMSGMVSFYLYSTQMFQPPSYITIVIAATRMHRSLVDFTSRPTEVYDVFYPLMFSPSWWSI